MAPSAWCKSSWRGEQKLSSVYHESSQHDLGDLAGIVGLYVVYGSWNRVPDGQGGLLHLFDEVLEPLARVDTKYSTGMIMVDSTESELDACFGDSTFISTKLPCPPPNLPTLLLIIRQKSMKEPNVRYVTNIASNHLVQLWHSRSPADDASQGVKASIETALQTHGLLPPRLPVSPTNGAALRIFVAGDRMSVGKTSVCLGLLGSLVAMGYPCESLAYIKPATQNEEPQLVQHYCEQMGIACVPIGPVVYYRGFTRAFLAHETESPDQLLAKVQSSVDALAKDKKVVIVDGVGFPAVGSICGTDNASVARASRANGVVLVGGSGVGGAVDAFNLNASYFSKSQVPVLGGIFNKLALEGFYSLENCKAQVTSYFRQYQPGKQAFGFVPLVSGLGNSQNSQKMNQVMEYIRVFARHVNVNALLEAAASASSGSLAMTQPTVEPISNPDPMEIESSPSNDQSPPIQTFRKRSREEIESAAIQAGAAPSA